MAVIGYHSITALAALTDWGWVIYRGEAARGCTVSKLWDRLEGPMIGEYRKGDAIAVLVCVHRRSPGGPRPVTSRAKRGCRARCIFSVGSRYSDTDGFWGVIFSPLSGLAGAASPPTMYERWVCAYRFAHLLLLPLGPWHEDLVAGGDDSW